MESNNFIISNFVDAHNLSHDYSGGVFQVDARGYFSSVCKDMHSYFLYTGVGIIIFSILESWLSYYFFNYYYKKLRGKTGLWLRNSTNRANAYLWMKERKNWVMTIYIISTIYLTM